MMVSSIENLPVELWFAIFSYLDGNDIKNAFSNLNTFVTKLLNSIELRIHINVNAGGCKTFKHNQAPFHAEVFEKLYGNTRGSCDLLNFMNTIKIFPNLRSLSLVVRGYKNYDIMMSMLPQLINLKYLALSCLMLFAETTALPLVTEILKLPQLRKCKVRFTPHEVNTSALKSILPVSTSLRHFHIDGKISSLYLCHLVQFMPSLRTLTVYAYRHDYEHWKILKSDLITKDQCRSFLICHVYLDGLIQIVPQLEQCRIHVGSYGYPIEQIYPDCIQMTKLHLQIICQKNATSNMFDIVSPMTIQTRTDFNSENIILKKLPIIG